MFENTGREPVRDNTTKLWAITAAFEIKGSGVRDSQVMSRLVPLLPEERAQVGRVEFHNVSALLQAGSKGVNAVKIEIPEASVEVFKQRAAQSGHFVVARGAEFADVVRTTEVFSFISAPVTSACTAG